jgi:alkylation response protein AidB-like acyl-CoA dehydrogenase
MAALTEEQTLIRDQAKSWVTEQAPVQQLRELRDSQSEVKYDAPTWQSMVEMGWTGILVPEQYGGSDLGYLTFGLILEETGRQLTASPLLASGLIGTSALLLGANDDQRHAWLPGLVKGEVVLTLAVDETPHHEPHSIALSASLNNGTVTLNGGKRHVPEAMGATHVIVAARAPNSGICLVLVPVDAAGVTRKPLSTVDSRGYANIDFEEVEVDESHLLGTWAQADELLESVLDCARAGLAAEMLGTASQAFDMTLEYLKTREQFGKVIGSFQALGHRAADLFSAMELSRSCMEGALQAIDSDAANTAQLVSLAKCRVGEFGHEMSNQLIQIHGGIGMTDEFDAGLYLKRARVLETTFGNRAFHRDRYATLLGF